MGRHYVPKVYLRHFAISEQLWAFDRQIARAFRTHIDNLAQQTKYYSDELEDYFAREIEGPVPTVIRAIREKRDLGDDQRNILARFLTAQLKRVPAGKERFHANFDHVADSVRHSTNEQIDSLVERDPSLAEIGRRRKDEVHSIIARYKDAPPDDIWYDVLGPDHLDNISNAVSSMRWYFFHAGEGEQFLICDNPVFFFSGLGLGNPEAELSFPVSHDVVLCADRRQGPHMFHTEARRQVVVEVNRRTVSNATRFVFARECQSWVERFAYGKSHKLRSIR